MRSQQTELIRDVQEALYDSGYIYSRGFKSKNSCFDLTARKDRILFIKCLSNVDNFQEEQKNELKLISQIFTGSPFLVGERNKHKEMEENIIYNKSGIPTLHLNTFKRIIKERFEPYIYSRQGGKFVKINESEFERERAEREISLSELASLVGVSKKTIYSYEKGKTDASLNIFQKLKKIFSSQIAAPLQIFSLKFDVDKELLEKSAILLDDLRNDVSELLNDMGLKVIWHEKALFDAITTQEEDLEELSKFFKGMKIITGLISKEEKPKQVYQKSQQIDSIAQVTQTPRMVITEKKISLSTASNVPIIEKDKLENIKDKENLLKKIVRYPQN